MPWIILLIIVIVIAVAYGTKKAAARKKTPPAETYVCDICGQDECICHKEHLDTKA